MCPSSSTTSKTGPVTYADLGVRPVINCRGTYTIVSGSRLLPAVAEAMVMASDQYIDMDELMEAVGRRLAALTGAEWGIITCGCAAALAQLAAACIAGADPEKIARLPDTSGMKREVVMQRAHRNTYDRALRLAGAVMVEVETRAELAAALTERTAMVAVGGDQEAMSTFPVSTMIAMAKARGIPVIVDAAAQRPDVPNRYLALGADAVCYSGGKCLRGPQASGLVLGSKALLQAAFLNGAPHHAMGRPMKAGKEEIMGLLTAVEAWLVGRDHAAEWRRWEGYLARIRAAVEDLPGVKTRVVPPGIFNVAPTLAITWDQDLLPCIPAQAHRALWEGDPRITLHLIDGGLEVMPYMMEAGDDVAVAERLRDVLVHHRPGFVAAGRPAVNLSGDWEVDIVYIFGSSHHAMRLEQDDWRLGGLYRSSYDSVRLAGSVAGRRVTFTARLGYQSNWTEYAFDGLVDDEGMAGQVTLDEFGSARWQAHRLR